MKNYKFLVPLVLVGLFLLSIYMVYDTKSNVQAQYSETIEAARDARTKGILVDAESYYNKALSIKASYELYEEIGEYYIEIDDMHKATGWAVNMVKAYPEDVRAYEFLIALYESTENYVLCFDYANQMKKRGLQSDIVDLLMSKIEYTYFFNGSYDDVGIFCGGYCPIRNGDKWGYVASNGKVKLQTSYQKAGSFVGGIAPIVDKNGEAYFIDENGNKKQVVTGVEHIEELGISVNGIFSLFDGKKWAYYNSDSEYLLGDYEAATTVGNGWGAVQKNGKWTIINPAGDNLNNETYDAVVMDEKMLVYNNDRMFVARDNGYIMLDGQGNIISEQGFEDARIFNDATYAAVKMDGAWGFVDNTGTIMLECEYEDARSFSNGLAAVKSGGMWGFIDMDGEIVIEPQFADAKDFTSGGSVFVKNAENRWTLLRLCKYGN